MKRDLFGQTEIETQPPDALPAGEKRARGAYFTPDSLARAITKTLGALLGAPADVFEPGCGGGAFLRAAHAEWPRATLLGVDLVPACEGPGHVLTGDLFAWSMKPDLVLGNPDFDIAEKVMRHGMKLLTPGGHLAFLLRAAFLGSTGRVALYREFPLRYVQPIAQRPCFTGDGKTDPMEYALFVWQQGWRGRGELLEPLVWR